MGWKERVFALIGMGLQSKPVAETPHVYIAVPAGAGVVHVHLSKYQPFYVLLAEVDSLMNASNLSVLGPRHQARGDNAR